MLTVIETHVIYCSSVCSHESLERSYVLIYWSDISGVLISNCKTRENYRQTTEVKRISKACENRDRVADVTKQNVDEECDFVTSERNIMMQVDSLTAAVAPSEGVTVEAAPSITGTDD
jgi:hypothetical protein